MSKFVIYKATNKVSGKSYVGKTASGLDKRRKEHINTARIIDETTSIFHRALNKYGADQFDWEILEVCSDHEHINLREVFHIAAANSFYPGGYNMTLGGGSYGYQRSIDTKNILSQKQKENHQNPEYRANLYPQLKGRTPPNKGVPMSEEQKIKVSKAKQAVYDDPNYVNPNVGQKRTGDALKNVQQGNLFRDLPTGEDWATAHKDQYTAEVRAKMRAAKIGKKPANTRQVVCIETGQVFSGLTEAAAALQVNRQSIWLQIKGKLKAAGGLHFKYLEEVKEVA